MKRTNLTVAALWISLAIASAGEGIENKLRTQFVSVEHTESVPLNAINSETSYTFSSDLNHGGSYGKQHALDTTFDYARRFQLSGNWYLRLGIDYARYDFGKTRAPVPDHLQSVAGIVGLDYMHGSDIGMLIELKPGFYTQNDFNIASFDMPITAGRIWVLQTDHTYLFTGINVAFLRGGMPVVPLVGLIWTPNEQWHAMAMLPEPRVVYSPNKDWDFWIGGELVGASFRTDRNDAIVPAKLNGTQVDYQEYRAGAGVIYSPTPWFCLDLGAGYNIERAFKFHRAGENYRTDPAPFVRLQLKAKF